MSEEQHLNEHQAVIEAFWHDRLGVILVCTDHGDVFYFQTPSDGSEAYLSLVAAHLWQYWGQNNKPHFSVN